MRKKLLHIIYLASTILLFSCSREADVAYEIEAGANKEEFVVDEPAQIEEKPAPKTAADVTAGVKEKEPVGKDTNVPAREKKERPLPDFMTMEQ